MIHVGAYGDGLYVGLIRITTRYTAASTWTVLGSASHHTPSLTCSTANMAAQLGQDTLAKDSEDGTRIGTATSENEQLQQAGLPAEDLSAHVLAADRS